MKKLIFILSCVLSNDKHCPPTQSQKTPLVKNIYDLDNNLLAHYEYNEKNQLVKRVGKDIPELHFFYKNDLIDKITEINRFGYCQPYVAEDRYFYNALRKVYKIETWNEDQLQYTTNVNYSKCGLITSLSVNENEPDRFFEYDSNGNIVKTRLSIYVYEPQPALSTEPDYYEEVILTYDTKNKINFGVNSFINLNLFPDYSIMYFFNEQMLSNNNIIDDDFTGIKFTIEYDENNNPKTECLRLGGIK